MITKYNGIKIINRNRGNRFWNSVSLSDSNWTMDLNIDVGLEYPLARTSQEETYGIKTEKEKISISVNVIQSFMLNDKAIELNIINYDGFHFMNQEEFSDEIYKGFCKKIESFTMRKGMIVRDIAEQAEINIREEFKYDDFHKANEIFKSARKTFMEVITKAKNKKTIETIAYETIFKARGL